MKRYQPFFRLLTVCALASALPLAGCVADDKGGGGGSGGSSGSGGSGGGTGGSAGATSGCANVDTTGCDVSLEPGANDDESVQTAFSDAKSGSTICLCPGTYSFTKELDLNVPNVTVKGLGASIEDTVMDYAEQTVDDDGFSVTSDGFTIENIWLKNTPGNGIVVTGASDVTFRKLKVSWDAGSVTANGAYAVYPVKSKNVIVEDTEVIGAADAGIYVGQCDKAIVRNSKVHGSVAGIEIENTTDAEVYGNEAYDNSAGILVFVLPNLEKKDGMRALVHDNNVHDNNHENFAEKGSIVSNVPPGTGMLVLAADQTEIKNNTIENNQSVGVLVVSMKTLDLVLATTPDPATDPYPEQTYIHDNTFTNNAQSPQGILDLFKLAPLENVIWDGQVNGTVTGDVLCLGDPPLPSFRNFNAAGGGLADNAKHSTDASPHECKFPELSPVSW
ncbi:MAG: right-handed parallel beta-helix repeat-containing protein [Myxococcales bacterium]|nr:right-handed parallel beta-helix repeat-containing protein [Myxococcales bacterium]MCB9577094.1 right-handed parallel beta-helix repeat-containing protein [Polyangiaceae bacterium]